MKDNATAKKGLKDKQNDPQNITRSMIEKPHTNLEGEIIYCEMVSFLLHTNVT
jgi:hypothetical protein